jgi:hypothetical protein
MMSFCIVIFFLSVATFTMSIIYPAATPYLLCVLLLFSLVYIPIFLSRSRKSRVRQTLKCLKTYNTYSYNPYRQTVEDNRSSGWNRGGRKRVSSMAISKKILTIADYKHTQTYDLSNIYAIEVHHFPRHRSHPPSSLNWKPLRDDKISSSISYGGLLMYIYPHDHTEHDEFWLSYADDFYDADWSALACLAYYIKHDSLHVIDSLTI